MLSTKQKKLIYRCAQGLLAVVVLGVALEQYFVQFDGLVLDATVIAWAELTALIIFGVYFCVLPLGGFVEKSPENRWYRAANRLGLIGVEVSGGLFIGAAVALVFWETLGQRAAVAQQVTGALVITAMLLLLLTVLVVGGLGVTGYIAKGNEETRQWARAWGQSGPSAPAEPTEEAQPPTAPETKESL